VSYTAPANGYITVYAKSTSAGAYMLIREEGIYGITGYAPGNSSITQVTLPVTKGRTYVVAVSTMTNITAQFIYAQGEVPTA
jgi:hypothetical protein